MVDESASVQVQPMLQQQEQQQQQQMQEVGLAVTGTVLRKNISVFICMFVCSRSLSFSLAYANMWIDCLLSYLKGFK